MCEPPRKVKAVENEKGKKRNKEDTCQSHRKTSQTVHEVIGSTHASKPQPHP